MKCLLIKKIRSRVLYPLLFISIKRIGLKGSAFQDTWFACYGRLVFTLQNSVRIYK